MQAQTNANRHRLFFPLIVLSVWTAFGLFFGTQNYVRDVYVGKGASLPGSLAGWLLCGYSWAILTVPVLRFVRRFSLERLGWSKSLLVHIPAAALFSLAQLGIYVIIAGFLFGNSDRGLWEFYKFILVKEFQSSFLVYFAIILAVTAYDRLFRASLDGQRVRPVETIEPNPAPHLMPSQNGRFAFLRRIPVKKNGRIILIETDDIDWIESYGNYVFLHTPERRHIFRETMAAMESKLDPKRFVRIRRSAIVNIDRIRELQPTINAEFEIVLKNGSILNSTRRYRKNLEIIVKP